MGRIRGVAALAAALMLWCAGTASADESRWTQPRTVAPSGVGAQAAVDDRGQVTVIWNEHLQSGAVMGAVRPPGAAHFTGPFLVGYSSGPSRLVVTPGGEVGVLTLANVCVYTGCKASWHMRLGPDLRRLGGEMTVAGDNWPGLAVAPNGRMMLAWHDNQGEGNIWESERRPGAPGFGAPVLVDTAGSGRFPSGGPSVAVNDQGDAAVAYTRDRAGDVSGEVPMTTLIALRNAGERFGPAQPLGPAASGSFGPGLVMSPDGSSTALFSQGVPAYRSRPAGEWFGPTVKLGDVVAEFTNTYTNPAGAAAALWPQGVGQQPYERTWYAAIKPADGGFGAARRLDLPGAGRRGAGAGVDPRGNTLITWIDEGDGRLRAGALGRFEPTLSEVSPPLGDAPAHEQGYPAVNSSGYAVAAYTEQGSGPDGSEGPVKVIERAPDPAGPGLVAAPLQIAKATVSARVRCSKPCQVSIGLTPGRRARAARSRSVLLPARRSGRVRLRLSARQRRALTRGRAKRVSVELRAVDSWGSRRTVRRKVPVKRLLGRRR